MSQPWKPAQPPVHQAPASISRRHTQPGHSPTIALTPASGDISPPSLINPSDLPFTATQLDEYMTGGGLDTLEHNHADHTIELPVQNQAFGYSFGLGQDLTPPQNLESSSQDFFDTGLTTYSHDAFNSSTDLNDSIPSGYQFSSTVPYPMQNAIPQPPTSDSGIMAQQPFLTPPQSAPSDRPQAHKGKRRRAPSGAISSTTDESQSEAAAHARFFVNRQFQKLSGLATYKARPVSSLLQWLREHIATPESQTRKRARTGGSNSAGPSHALTAASIDVDSEFEAVLRKEAGKVRSLADLLDKPVQELLNSLENLAGGETEPSSQDSILSQHDRHATRSEPKARNAEAFLEFARVAASKICRARTSTTNPNGVLKCLRSDCAGAYDKKKKSSWLRHIAQMVPDILYACPRDDCSFIDTRLEWVVNHLHNKHAIADHQDARAQAEQEPFKVPFNAQCGWCTYQSTDWQEFFGTHVYNHLTGEGGSTQATKEQWQGHYPPQPFTKQNRKKRPSPGCHNNFWNSKRSDEPDDDDDDDEDQNDAHFPPPGSGQMLNGNQAFSQIGLPLNATNSGYGSQTDQGQTRNCREASISQKFEGVLEGTAFLQMRDVNVPGEAVTDPSPVSLSKLPFGKAEPLRLPFRSLKSIYQGSKSTVDAVLYEDTGLVLARKRVHSIAKLGKLHQLYRREVEAMLRVRHTHTVKLVDYFMGNDVYTLVVQPIADLSLKQYLELQPPNFCENLFRWQGCLASAIAYLHSPEVGICHQDIKPGNVLIKDEKVHLADFGSSRFVKLDVTTRRMADEAPLPPTPMTPMYTPPEAYKQPLHGTSLDIYALGIVILEMLTVIARIPVRTFHESMRHFTGTLTRVALATELQAAITRWIDRLLESGSHRKGSCPGFRLTLGRIRSMTSIDSSNRPTAREVATWLPDSCEYADGVLSPGQDLLPLSHKVSEFNSPKSAVKATVNTTTDCGETMTCFGNDTANHTHVKTESTFRIKRLSDCGRCDSLLSTGSWCDVDMFKGVMDLEPQASHSNIIFSRSNSLDSETTATKKAESQATNARKGQELHDVPIQSISTRDPVSRTINLSKESMSSKLSYLPRSPLGSWDSIERECERAFGENASSDSMADKNCRLEPIVRGIEEHRRLGSLQDATRPEVDTSGAARSDFKTTAFSQTQLYLDKCSTGTHSRFWLETIDQLWQKSSQQPWLTGAAREENRAASEVLYSIMLHRAMKKERSLRNMPRPKLPVQEPHAKNMPLWIQSNLLDLKKTEQSFRQYLDQKKEQASPAVTEAFYDNMILELAASLKLLIMLCGAPDSANTALRRRLLQVLTHADMQRKQLSRSHPRAPSPSRQHKTPHIPPNFNATAPPPPSDLPSNTAGPLSAFTIYAGEIQLVHRADDLRATDVKWHGWSRLCHNVPWRASDPDADVLAQLRYVAHRYRGKHAALAGAAIRRVRARSGAGREEEAG